MPQKQTEFTFKHADTFTRESFAAAERMLLNCAAWTFSEFDSYACSQRGWVLVCWGKGVLLGVAPLFVYTERYLVV